MPRFEAPGPVFEIIGGDAANGRCGSVTGHVRPALEKQDDVVSAGTRPVADKEDYALSRRLAPSALLDATSPAPFTSSCSAMCSIRSPQRFSAGRGRGIP
jgi:hypothetical protein